MENIEAMLCAYIEGDLDEAGRAQIEKHLLENPQHRKLMAELVAMRELVKDLPRVKAPVDVGESLRGQVERSMLLDDSLSAGPGNARANRLPQMFAIAAILLLCASLVMVLYKALGPTLKRPAFTESAASKMPDIQIAEDSPKSAAIPTTQELFAADVRATTEHPISSGLQAAASAGGSLDGPHPEIAVLQQKVAALAQLDVDSIRRRLKSSGYGIGENNGNSSAPVLMVVNSSNPPATSVQVTQFLSSNSGISWKLVPADIESKSTPTTLPSPGLPHQDKALGPGGESSASPLAVEDRAKETLDYSAPTTQPSSDVYVARGLTLLQADALRQSLSDQQNGGADVQVSVQSAAVLATATTQPTAIPDDKDGDTFRSGVAVTPPDTRPSVVADASVDLIAAPTTAPSNTAAAGVNGATLSAQNSANFKDNFGHPMALSNPSGADNSQNLQAVDAVIVIQSASAPIPVAQTTTRPDMSGQITAPVRPAADLPPTTQPAPSTQP